MSLVVNNLTKIYGRQKALDNISFSIGKGEIVGFLGPNGAGKSTTMKIATTAIAATDGDVQVAGFDVQRNSFEVKQRIGYLPEHNPLYLDMYVREYLTFVGKLYPSVASRVSHRVDEMIEACGLQQEQNKRIEALSKGYRQRVGIAQALIHDPEVLILDEPTTGLDPNQILEIRRLIKTVAHNKTVVFSTHIMQEVQAICDRVILINKGQIVADSELSALLAGSNGFSFIVEFQGLVNADDLRGIEGVVAVNEISPEQYRIASRTDIRSEIFRTAAEKRLNLTGLRQEEVSLESIFQQLTRS